MRDEKMSTNTPLVKMQGITKRFPGVLANDHVDLEVQAGQVHALLGENGAGKTTLMNILSGLYRADEGEIYIRVVLPAPFSPSRACTWPACTSRSTWSLASTPGKRLVILRILTKGDLVERIGTLSRKRVRQILDGVSLLLEPRDIEE